MKLNKPPVSEEQSILEEYVGFLLTDLSNVHPLKQEPQKKKQVDSSASKSRRISDLIDDKKLDNSDSKNAVAAIEKAANESLTREEVEKTDKENKAEPSVSKETVKQEEKPKWSTIEQASVKRKRKQISQSVPASSAQTQKSEATSKSQEISDKATEPHSNRHKHDKNLANDIPHGFVEEEPEEEQLKKWDALITKEKEAEILAGIEADEIESEQAVSSLTEEADSDPLNQQKSDSTVAQDPISQTQQIIKEYLPQEEEKDPRLANVEKLLSRISLATMPAVQPQTTALNETEQQAKVEQTQQAEQSAEAAKATFLHRETQRSKDILPEVFQTLIFKVGKLPLAVPLLKLGGIIKISKQDITPLVGSPDWFLGLVPNERGNLMVVDTQKYIMPEQMPNDDEEYQYLIVLDNSNWAMACHSVGDAKNLTHDDIRWSEKSSQRPWFAGMVVDYMSALIEVDELINMLADNIVD